MERPLLQQSLYLQIRRDLLALIYFKREKICAQSVFQVILTPRVSKGIRDVAQMLLESILIYNIRISGNASKYLVASLNCVSQKSKKFTLLTGFTVSSFESHLSSPYPFHTYSQQFTSGQGWTILCKPTQWQRLQNLVLVVKEQEEKYNNPPPHLGTRQGAVTL